MKPIRLSQHALDYLPERGTTITEVEDSIRSSEWVSARGGRLECRKDFTFDSMWNGKHYMTKQVRPIFVEEQDAIVVVTLYVYYF